MQQGCGQRSATLSQFHGNRYTGFRHTPAGQPIPAPQAQT